MQCWRRLEERCARRLPSASCCEVRFDQCRFGTLYLTPTALLCTSQHFARCKCTAPHVRLEGSCASKAAEYPTWLCEEVGGRQSSRSLRLRFGPQRLVHHLWASHIAESLPWRTARACKFKKANHIDVLECRVHKTLMHRMIVGCW